MDYITLGDDVKMPMVGFGTWEVRNREEGLRAVLDAVDAGYRLIDTARAYGNEALVGAAIAQCGVPREELFITTKVWFRHYEEDACRDSLEKSFAKLGVDYLDLVLLHWPLGNTYCAWRVLEEYKAAGRIRAIGVSNFEPAQLMDLMEFNEQKPVLNQVEAHLYSQRSAEKEWFDKLGVATQAYSPLGQGHANRMFEEPAVQAAAEAHGKTPGQILLKHLVQRGIAVIPKSSNPERIAQNIDLFDFELSAEEMAALSALDEAHPMTGRPNDPHFLEGAFRQW